MKQLPEVMSILGTGKILEHISDSTAITESIAVILYFCHRHSNFRIGLQFTEVCLSFLHIYEVSCLGLLSALGSHSNSLSQY